ncbi:MAG: hypothetical protein D6767_05020 [Candidatus Hydrogenedentota bacterium]|nr:MAG: hypothetical protein D6767_05020 [Candidatus Hydrogenedentota bacterium]
MKHSESLYDALTKDEDLQLPPKLDIAKLAAKEGSLSSKQDTLQKLVEEKTNAWMPRVASSDEKEESNAIQKRNEQTLQLAQEVELDLDALDKILNLKREGQKLYAQKMYVEALGRFEEALQVLPGDLEIMYYHALCCFQLKNYRRALMEFREIDKLDKGTTLPNLEKLISLSLVRLNQLKEAEEYLKEVLKHKKRDNQLMNILVYVLERQDKLEEAKTYARKILESEPENPNANNSLAWILYRQNGNLTDALNYVRQALLVEQNNPAYLDTLAMIYLKLNKQDLAVETLKKALALAPGNEEILTHISKLLAV